MKIIRTSLYILIFLSLSAFVGKVAAQPSIFPVAALSNCRDAKECYLYCQIPENKAACWSYGKYVLSANVLGVSTVSDEEKKLMEDKARQHGITFPIAELGNCANVTECRNLCEQPANYQACMDFAKKKGFAKDVDQSQRGIPQEKRLAVMQSARTELGCTSLETCRTICEQDHVKCESFAKKHGLTQGPSPEEIQQKTDLLNNAKTDLGCDSQDSCRIICETNPSRCVAFARKYGLDRGGEPERNDQAEGSASGRGPSIRPPCANETSCKQYCKAHPDECPGYQGKPSFVPAGGPLRPSSGSGAYLGPTGCRTEEECKAYCQSNPTKCPGFPKPYPPPSVTPYPSYGSPSAYPKPAP
ncbi:hypothetical protein HY086_03170 [Candidatus Gottesmanbacteria bacterium]|nr:hypothetical protein [Candidatus Gottesmanbacteria bacterium]